LAPKYPLKVIYCPVNTLPAELADCLPAAQFEKCKPWLREHTPYLFPEIFPEECAALAAGTLTLPAVDGGEDSRDGCDIDEDGKTIARKPKVAVPIEQKTSGGKKKKAPAEITLALGQRKGKKQVTIAYGLDLFGIKLKDATKAAKRKFATGSSITTSADSRDVIEIQGARQKDFADLLHKEFGVPKEALYIINSKKKKEAAFPKE